MLGCGQTGPAILGKASHDGPGKGTSSANLFPSVGDTLYEGVGSPTVQGKPLAISISMEAAKRAICRGANSNDGDNNKEWRVRKNMEDQRKTNAAGA